jgi:hypothetical protein
VTHLILGVGGGVELETTEGDSIGFKTRPMLCSASKVRQVANGVQPRGEVVCTVDGMAGRSMLSVSKAAAPKHRT